MVKGKCAGSEIPFRGIRGRLFCRKSSRMLTSWTFTNTGMSFRDKSKKID
jgi:hypothetical protein